MNIIMHQTRNVNTSSLCKVNSANSRQNNIFIFMFKLKEVYKDSVYAETNQSKSMPFSQ